MKKTLAIVIIFLFLSSTLLVTNITAQDAPGSLPTSPDTKHQRLDFFTYEIPNSAGEGFEPHIIAGPAYSNPEEEWLYIDSPTGLGGGVSGNLWISKDQGLSWEPHPYGRNALGSGDSYTAIAKDGTIYYTDLYLWSSTIDTSHDGGETWIRNPLATTTRLGDRQWLQMGPNMNFGPQSETLYMVYNDIPQGLIIQRSSWTEQGLVWVQGNLRRPVTTSTGSRDHFAVDTNDGTIYCPNKDGGGIAVYVSDDGANSFSRYQVISTDQDIQNIFVAADVDPAGNVYLTWSNQFHIFLGISQDKGQTWSVTQVTNTAGTRVFPWVVAGDPGRVGLTWYDTTDTEGGSDDKSDTTNWSCQAAFSTNALTDDPTNISFTITPIMEWVHTGAIRTTGTGGDSDRDLGDFFTCDINVHGQMIVTYGADFDDGPNARGSLVYFAKQEEGPFLMEDTGPDAYFDHTTDMLTVNTDASLSIDMNGEGLSEYSWAWGDGNETNGTDPMAEYTYENAGSYRIKLKVTNNLGLKHSYFANATVIAPEEKGFSFWFVAIPVALIIMAVAVGVAFYIKKKK